MSVTLTAKAQVALKNDGKIDRTEAAELAKLATTPDAKKELGRALQRDNFDRAARADLSKLFGGKPPAASLFLGMQLGTNKYGEEVRVTRELGDLKGFDSKFQATAAARMSGADPTAVVQGSDGKWHALETTANFFGGGTANDTPTRQVFGLTSNAQLEQVRSELKTLHAEYDALPPGAASDRKFEELKDKQLQLAMLTFGVDRNELQFISNPANRTEGVINIDAGLKKGDNRGQHGPVRGEDENYARGQKHAFEVSLNELENPDGANGVLFHEVTHNEDFNLTNRVVDQYEKQTGRIFVQSATQPFVKWIQEQVKNKQLTPAQAELVQDEIHAATASTEARAFVKTALAAMEAGNPEQAKDQLATYAGAMKKPVNGSATYQPPLNGSQVQKELTQEIRAAYQSWPKAMQNDFKAAIAAAKQRNPDAWVAKLQLD